MPARLSEYAKWMILPLHAFAAVAIVVGLRHPAYFYWTLIGWLLVGPIGVGIGFHRLLAHRSFECRSWIRSSLIALGFLSGQGSPLAWAALHRHHHENADQELDLHSPRKGWWTAYTEWQLFDQPIKQSVAIPRDLVSEKWLCILHRNSLKIFWLVFFAVALLKWQAALFLIALPAVLYAHQVNCVDVICHMPRMGYRNFDTPDDSCNHLLLGYLTLGVGFHNNHHAEPSNWFFQKRWFEFDLGGYLTFLLKKI